MDYFLAHLSQRLIGEFKVYPWCASICLPVVHPLFTVLKHLLRNRWANQSQILCGAFFWVGVTKVSSRHLGHMTKIATTPIYGKNP